MEQKEPVFPIKISFKGKTIPFNVTNPADSLSVIMDKFMSLVQDQQLFSLPLNDPSGAPYEYYFGKKKANGEEVFMRPTEGGKDMYLHDYSVNPNDELIILQDILPG